MSSRRRERRAERTVKRKNSAVVINIVSLIDIFAILVFYLLVNALVVEVIPSPRSLKLPESAIKEQPRQTVTIIVTAEDVLVDNRAVMSTQQALKADVKLLAPLKSALLLAPLMQVEGDTQNRLTRGEVNIVADKSIPYSLLKKVMATCTDTRFARISLAVVEKKGS
ncbi:ExbD/TolR family protein [Hydrocarboniphaga sp.]|uniref:ExbD/TolR family protein n=1 Tax=Hydrocarboniphaga sp. TaxID=2033016 RepID=UPI003D10007A